MTVQQDVQRAGLRALMAESLAIPDYEDDPKVVGRVGKVIGETAGHEERHVRASDSPGGSTSAVDSPDSIIWFWIGLSCTLATAVALGALAYWSFG